MALPTKSTATGTTPTTVVYQPLGGGRRRIVLIAIATTVALLALAATQSLVTATSDTRGGSGQPIENASAVTPIQVPTEPTQPLGVPLGPSESLRCGLACTDEMAALWRARTEPNADHDAIERAFTEAVRITLDTIGQVVVDAARSLP